MRDVRRLAVEHSDPGIPGVSSLHYHIQVLHSIIYWQILYGSMYPLRIIRKLTLRRDFGHSRTRKRLSQIPRQELSELPLHYSRITISLHSADPVAGAGGCVEADHVQRLVLLARADSSTKA